MERKGRVRKIAMTVWGGRISPVFDSARTLLIVELVDDEIGSLSFQEFDPDRPMQLVQMLRDQDIMIVICGAVSEGPAHILETAGLELIPFIAGSVKEVVKTFLLRKPVWTELTMPGYDRRILSRNESGIRTDGAGREKRTKRRERGSYPVRIK